jgi:hypothetical protein
MRGPSRNNFSEHKTIPNFFGNKKVYRKPAGSPVNRVSRRTRSAFIHEKPGKSRTDYFFNRSFAFCATSIYQAISYRQLITMTAIMRKSLTTVVMAPGLSLREADSTAAAIVINGSGMYLIPGYRSGDAERERLPAARAAVTRPGIMAAQRGIFPERVDRDSILLHCRLNLAGPGSRGEYDGTAGWQWIFSPARGTAGLVCW